MALQQYWMTARYIALLLCVSIGPHLPQSGSQLLVFILIGVAIVALVLPWVVTALHRTRTLIPHGPPARLRSIPTHRLPGAPGAAGSVRARAPSVVARASA